MAGPANTGPLSEAQHNARPLLALGLSSTLPILCSECDSALCRTILEELATALYSDQMFKTSPLHVCYV